MVMFPVHRSPWGRTKNEKIWVVLVVLQASILVVFWRLWIRRVYQDDPSLCAGNVLKMGK